MSYEPLPPLPPLPPLRRALLALMVTAPGALCWEVHNPTNVPVTTVHLVQSAHLDIGCKTGGCSLKLKPGEPDRCKGAHIEPWACVRCWRPWGSKDDRDCPRCRHADGRHRHLAVQRHCCRCGGHVGARSGVHFDRHGVDLRQPRCITRAADQITVWIQAKHRLIVLLRSFLVSQLGSEKRSRRHHASERVTSSRPRYYYH
jgi:hypothetical protein